MTFLNKKEEVLNVEITSFGKHLLSIGQFEPVFYAFFDDEILYDSDYVGITESQNDIHNRIKDAPQPIARAVFHGIETEIVKSIKNIKNGEPLESGLLATLSSAIQSTSDKHKALSAPIGTISLESNDAPAWMINVLKGEISGSTAGTSDDQTILKIPQITMQNLEYKTKSIIDDTNEMYNSELSLLVEKFSDGSFIQIFEDSIVLDVSELNSVLTNENFEMEIFLRENEDIAGLTKENLIPLNFGLQRRNLIKNNILLDEDTISFKENELNASCVEYFFNVFIDDEIDQSLCEVGCKPAESKLYSSPVTEEILKDKC